MHAGVVAVLRRLHTAADVHEVALRGAAGGTSADPLGEVDAVRERLRLRAGGLERRRRGDAHDRLLEALEIRASLERLKADLLEVVGDVLRGGDVARRAAESSLARRIADVREVLRGTRRIERAGDRHIGARGPEHRRDDAHRDEDGREGGKGAPRQDTAERDRRPLEHRAQAVAEHVEAEDGARERRGGNDRDPRGAVHGETPAGQDRAPFGARKDELRPTAEAAVVDRDAEAAAHDDAEEPELAEREQDRARLERARHREDGHEVRQDVPREERELGEAERASGLEEGPALQRDDRRARRAAEAPPPRDREREDERGEARADVEGEDP